MTGIIELPCTYQIYRQAGLLRKVFSGTLTARPILHMIDQIESDPSYKEGMAQLIDMTAVTNFAVTISEIAHFADLVIGLNAREGKHLRIALLVSNASGRAGAFAYCRMLEGKTTISAEPFETLPEALAFLGISNDVALRQSLLASARVN